jgi:hypothetical protein
MLKNKQQRDELKIEEKVSSKPLKKKNKTIKKDFTVSIVVPSSVVDNAQVRYFNISQKN